MLLIINSCFLVLPLIAINFTSGLVPPSGECCQLWMMKATIDLFPLSLIDTSNLEFSICLRKRILSSLELHFLLCLLFFRTCKERYMIYLKVDVLCAVSPKIGYDYECLCWRQVKYYDPKFCLCWSQVKFYDPKFFNIKQELFSITLVYQLH